MPEITHKSLRLISSADRKLGSTQTKPSNGTNRFGVLNITYFGFSSTAVLFDRIKFLHFLRNPRFLDSNGDKAEDRSRLVDMRRRRTFSYDLKNDVHL